MEKASTTFTESNREINTKEINCFIHDRDPKYKLRVEENVVHDSFARRSIRHGIYVPDKVLHQLVMIIATAKARMMPPELVPRVQLGNA